MSFNLRLLTLANYSILYTKKLFKNSKNHSLIKDILVLIYFNLNVIVYIYKPTV
jgi:hypothetical protein